MRNRYLDVLRAVAIMRVVTYHTFGRAWMTVILPAMGLMFAIAGSLMASSLEANGGLKAVTSRIRRLVPSLWVLGAVAVPVMLLAGWAAGDSLYPFDKYKLIFWLLPISDPPGSTWGLPFWDVLWYLRAYLWFVLLTPFVYFFYRKMGWIAVFAPLALLTALTLLHVPMPVDPVHIPLWDIAIYGACWMAGFAHHDGRLQQLPKPWLIGISAGSAVIGMAWLVTHGNIHTASGDLNDIPVAQGFWSFAFVLLLMRWQPSLSWMPAPLTGFVGLLNKRAVTIYVWHNPMIALAGSLLTAISIGRLDGLVGFVVLALGAAFTAVAVLATGWVEDLAARRRPVILPNLGLRKQSRPNTAADLA